MDSSDPDEFADATSDLDLTPVPSSPVDTTMSDPSSSTGKAPALDPPKPKVYTLDDWNELADLITNYSANPEETIGFRFTPEVPLSADLRAELTSAFLGGKSDYNKGTIGIPINNSKTHGETVIKIALYEQGYNRAEFLALKLHSGNQQPRAKAPKTADPEFFEGDTEKFSIFKLQLNLKFNSDPATYGTDAAKIVYAGSYLHGAAQASMKNCLDDPKYIATTTYEAFLEQLRYAYADPDLARTADRKIRALRQGKDPVTLYNAKFSEYAAILGWNDSAKMSQFRQGLSEEVKNMLMHRPRPTTMAELLALSIEVDNSWRSRAAEVGDTSRFHRNTVPIPGQRNWVDFRSPARQTPIISAPANPPAAGSRPIPSTASGTHPGPMDLSAARTLTPEMKKFRRDNHLCLYCGKAGHFASACPNKRSRGPARVNAITSNETPGPDPAESETSAPESAVVLYGDEPKN